MRIPHRTVTAITSKKSKLSPIWRIHLGLSFPFSTVRYQCRFKKLWNINSTMTVKPTYSSWIAFCVIWYAMAITINTVIATSIPSLNIIFGFNAISSFPIDHATACCWHSLYSRCKYIANRTSWSRLAFSSSSNNLLSAMVISLD